MYVYVCVRRDIPYIYMNKAISVISRPLIYFSEINNL